DGGSAFAPNATSLQEDSPSLAGGVPGVPDPAGQFSVNSQSEHHFVSYDSCPATGPIEYVSDAHNSVIFIYKGKFAGQVPCGQITSDLRTPYGLYVQRPSHDLYVHTYGRFRVLVFLSAQSARSNRCRHPTG